MIRQAFPKARAVLAICVHPKGVMIHIDRGSQYCAKALRKIIKANGLIQGMVRKANCWDNAVSESFFATLKKQSVYGLKSKSRDALRQHIFEFIEIHHNPSSQALGQQLGEPR
jgi:putative transposase